MSYRFHLDIPLGDDQEAAISAAKNLITLLQANIGWDMFYHYGKPQVRLGNDDDRGVKNYLRINENGHATGGKSPL